MDVRLIPFKKEHLECMDMRPHEAALLTDTENLVPLERGSVACTGIIDGRVIACGGLTPVSTMAADIWLIPSIYASAHKVTFARRIKRWLFDVRAELALSRLQSYCLDDGLHNAWMTFLGFEKERNIKEHHNDKTYNYWGRIWE